MHRPFSIAYDYLPYLYVKTEPNRTKNQKKKNEYTVCWLWIDCICFCLIWTGERSAVAFSKWMAVLWTCWRILFNFATVIHRARSIHWFNWDGILAVAILFSIQWYSSFFFSLLLLRLFSNRINLGGLPVMVLRLK